MSADAVRYVSGKTKEKEDKKKGRGSGALGYFQSKLAIISLKLYMSF